MCSKKTSTPMELMDKGYRVHFFAIEVGARGIVGRSSYFLLQRNWPAKQRKEQNNEKNVHSG